MSRSATVLGKKERSFSSSPVLGAWWLQVSPSRAGSCGGGFASSAPSLPAVLTVLRKRKTWAPYDCSGASADSSLCSRAFVLFNSVLGAAICQSSPPFFTLSVFTETFYRGASNCSGKAQAALFSILPTRRGAENSPPFLQPGEYAG